ncbi:MAG: ATP-binding cassette domain-containing protein [Eggerthellaceae bacterium]|nr:ATP-binding cassette domain-containing protein [Eggerthellaceae bacterium]
MIVPDLTAPAADAPSFEDAAHGGAPAAARPAFIAFEDASFTYDGASFVFEGLSLTVPQGQFCCLLGGNGSGKSTLARCVNALLTPDAGRVLTFGRDTRDADATYFIRSNAGLVFQSPDDQLVASVVENDVAFGPENLGVPAPELAERVSRALGAVGLQGFQRSETASLSGGQKQRVAIAGVLAMDPALLILDEASAMLDPRGRAGLMRVCRELHDEGLTILMITHYMEEAAQAERVVVLDAGRVVMDGGPDEVLTRGDELRALALDVPFAAALAADLRGRGVAVAPCVDAATLRAELDAARAAAGRAAGADAAGGSDGTAASDAPGPSAPANESPSPADAAPLIALEGVSYSYGDPERRERRRRRRRQEPERADWGPEPGAVWALRDVTLTVREGELLGIAGHTGSGKSTLAQLLNGLARPTRGRVLLRGEDLSARGAAERARAAVGLVFQYPEHQLFAATVYDDVAFGPRNLGLAPAEVDGRVRRALAGVGLDFDAVQARSPFELSGGQQRRVALAGVLAMEPEALVLDEPVAGLDPRGREELLALIERLHAGGLTCVIVSHSMDDLARLADRVLVLNEGAVFSLGTPAEVFADPAALHGVGLGVPEAQALALDLRRDGWPLPRALYDEASLADDVAAALAGEGARHGR